MDIREYQQKAKRTIVPYDKIKGSFFTGQLNIVGEAGEIIEQYNDKIARNIPFDREHLIEELGDVLWGCSFVCELSKIDLKEVLDDHMIIHIGKRGDFKKFGEFSKIVNCDPGYDQSERGLYHENLISYVQQVVRDFDVLAKADKIHKDKAPEEVEIYKNYIKTALKYHIGDTIEMLSLIANKELFLDLDDIANANIDKLEKRYDPTKIVREIVSNKNLYNLMEQSLALYDYAQRALINTPGFFEDCAGNKDVAKLKIGDNLNDAKRCLQEIYKTNHIKSDYFKKENLGNESQNEDEQKTENIEEKFKSLTPEERSEQGVSYVREVVNSSVNLVML